MEKTMAQKVFDDVLKKGEEIFQNVSGKLLEKPAVAKAFEAAMVGKMQMEEGFTQALKRMNVQTRSEFRGLKGRVETLEAQLAEMREALAAAQAKASERPAAKPRARKAAKKA
jgi:polyhydroxyalkanoate synthesis regulator phasin